MFAGYSSGVPQGEASLSQFIKHRGEYGASVAMFAITASYIQRNMQVAFENVCHTHKTRLALQWLGWLTILMTFSYLGMSTVNTTSYSQRLYNTFHSGPVVLAFALQLAYFSVVIHDMNKREKHGVEASMVLSFTLYLIATLTTGVLQFVRYYNKSTLPLVYPRNMYYTGFEICVLVLESLVSTFMYMYTFAAQTKYAKV
jgi:hypothetical protein